MKLLTAYFSYAKDPAQTLRELVEQRRFAAAVGGYIVAALSWLVLLQIGTELGAWPFVLKFGVLFAAMLTGGYFASALSGLFLELTGTRSGASGLFIILGITGYAASLLLVFSLYATAMPWLWPLTALAVLLVWAVQLIFAVKGVSRVYNLTVGKAFGILLFSVVPVAAVGFLGIAFFVWFVSSLL